jgi:hypothetical protein
MLCVGAVVLLIGMLAGIAMRIEQDFALAPTHAKGWLHIVGAILLPAGVAIVVRKGAPFIAAPIVGSLIMVAAMALFVVIALRTSRA